MKNKKNIFLFFIFLLFACGTETIVYLYPVTSATWTKIQSTVSFTLPRGQPAGYFDEYVIYYRIYLSASDLDITDGFGTSELTNLNGKMQSDYNSINPYTTSSDKPPDELRYLLENRLEFKPLSFAAPVQTGASLDIINNEERKTLTREDANVNIDFKVLQNSFLHPIMTITTTSTQTYRILRYDSPRTLPSRDFLYSTALEGLDVDRQADKTKAYAMLYIVASGTNEFFSTIFSQATFLGVFRLPRSI